MTMQAFTEFVDRIEATEVPRDLAGHYAALIGTTAWTRGDEVIVFEDVPDEEGHPLPGVKREIARLPVSVLNRPLREKGVADHEGRLPMELRFSNGAVLVLRPAWPPGSWRLEISGPPVPSLKLIWSDPSSPEAFIPRAAEAAEKDGLTMEVRTPAPPATEP